MPTPDRIKAASLAKRQRVCRVCGAQFVVRSADRLGASCSPPCRKEVNRLAQTGRVQSEETKAKRSASMKQTMSDPVRKEARSASARAALSKLWDDPEFRARRSQASSERMRQRHADPAWQRIRDERSSRVMKANWEKHRDIFTQQALDRYERGVCSLNQGEAEERKRAAAKWIMTQAQASLHSETNYDEVFRNVQARIRSEHPFYGDTESRDYYEYCQKIGKMVTSHPECRAIADQHLGIAITRFSAQWQAKKSK